MYIYIYNIRDFLEYHVVCAKCKYHLCLYITVKVESNLEIFQVQKSKNKVVVFLKQLSSG